MISNTKISNNQKYDIVIERNTFYFYNPEFQEKYEGYINSLKETLLVLKNKILQGDSLELFKNIPNNSVDMTFADPPFNLKKGYNSYKDSLQLEEYIHWCKLWISEMVRVTKPTGTILVHNIPKWLTYYSAHLNTIADFKHWISWDAPTAPMGKTLQPAHYGILFYAKDAK